MLTLQDQYGFLIHCCIDYLSDVQSYISYRG